MVASGNVELRDAGERQWVVSCDLGFRVFEPAEVVLQVAVARSAGTMVSERLDVVHDGSAAAGVPRPTTVPGPHRSLLHVLDSPSGQLQLSYRAVLRAGAPGSPSARAGDPGARSGGDYDRQVYLRPSRYCPSDHLIGFAVAEFGSTGQAARSGAITDWIRERIGYVPGSGSVHDSAEDTLLTAVGTCRDFAHLGIALSRATGIPARFAAVYAPGLTPMDFHAVFETLEEGRWYAHDATGLAPRRSMVRMATGRDAADTAFAAITAGIADLETLDVTATVEPFAPEDDPRAPVELA